MEEISLKINGKNIGCEPGKSILDVATENAINIPTLCHHPHLEPVGACRICLVEDENNGRIMASCVTPVAPDMAIQTDSPAVIKHRRNVIRLMMANHPESCIVCNQGNRCELRQVAADLGLGAIGLYPMPHYMGLEEANPFIIRDLTKCILCGKCIRADHELVVVGAIDFNVRGFKSRPATAHEMPLEKSNCTFCGTCVSLCPTGALVVKNTEYVGSPQKESTSVCGFCGVGCLLLMGSVDGRLVEANPSHEDGTVNQSTLCVRGHFANDFLNVPERLTHPLIRKDGELSIATWDEALEFVAERLTGIKKKHGPQSLGLLGSSKCSNEENYLFQKMGRAILGTNNVDNGGYLAGRPTLRPVVERLDGAGRIMPLSGLEQAEVIFAVGANPTQSVPVVSYYMKRAASMKGVPMIVVDPRKTGLVPFSSFWLPINPKSDSELINSMAAILHKRAAHNARFIERFTEGFDQYQKGLASFSLERASQITGIKVDTMEAAAGQLEGKRIAFVVGQGVLQQRHGIRTMNALLNLALMTGSLGGKGKGFYFLATENNQVGAWDMGTVPDFLPGRQPIGDSKSRKHWEQNWGTKLSPDPGLNVVRMIEEAEKGNLKALYIMGENPLRALPQPERVRKALDGLEFLVVQDILSNETTQRADVVLPGAPFSEKGGSFTNMEGRIQCFDPVVSPAGEARADWEILDLLGSKMGYPQRYPSIQRIREEIGNAVTLYSQLEEGAAQSWINETSPLRLFAPDGVGETIHFTPVISAEEDKAKKGYPFTAILGSLRYHLGSGSRTGHSERIKDFALKGEVEMSLEDGAALHLSEGDTVSISSPHGAIRREVGLKKGLRPGLIFIPVAFNGNDAMQLLDLTQLGMEDSPGWKEIQVKIEKLDT